MTNPEIELSNLLSLVPTAAGQWRVDWQGVEGSVFGDYARRMAQTPQEREWHAEGDVWTHTKLVCEALASDGEFRALDPEWREIVFLAALAHDVGKIWRTKEEDGKLVSPGHARAGANEMRTFLWRELDLCGAPAKRNIREAICGLIRAHTLPPYLTYEEDWRRKLLKYASLGELLPGFSYRCVDVLSRADILGRVASGQREALDRVEFAAELAREAGVYDAPFAFDSPRSRFLYFDGRDVAPELPAFDETWGEVVMTSGLAGVGKDTWIRANMPDAPTISLDAIRLELKAPHGEKEALVVETAFSRAKDFLRAKTPFVWNATSVTASTRQKLENLVHRYSGSMRVVYLETSLATNLKRNATRQARIPESAIYNQLERLEPPTLVEAERVEWIET